MFRAPMPYAKGHAALIILGLFGATLRSQERVLQQHGNGHGPHTPRHWRDRAGNGAGSLIVHVAHEAVSSGSRSVLDAIDPYIDDRGSWANHCSRNQPRAPNSRYEDVGFPADVRHAFRTAVAYGDCGISALLHQ